MRQTISFFACCILFVSCTQQDSTLNVKAKKTIDHRWLDSVIKQHSDSSYAKPYKRTDFVTAAWYINKKDSSVCQLMRDSADTVRQVIIAKKAVRTFFAQYYENGQLQADLPLDEFGQYHGTAAFFYKDGTVENSGTYMHGLKTGKWQNYNEKGKLVSTDEYDINGQMVKTVKVNN